MVQTISQIMVQTIFLMLTCGLVSGQVPNDKIENRLPLTLNQWHVSRTDSCTVQWNCVDESLTGKCIDYHNDQWFTFTTAAAGTYYVNIARQQCRDIRGVQLVVLEGTPCQTTTYRILTCVSLASQDDIYVQLDSLKPSHTYLLNVDGYLHDYCRFSIQVGGQPQGFPMNQSATGTVTANTEAGFVDLFWKTDANNSSQLLEFQIFRRMQSEAQSKQIGTVVLKRDTHGTTQELYQFRDTLAVPALCFYKIVGQTTDDKTILIGEYQKQARLTRFADSFVRITVPYKLNTNATLLIYNALDDSLIRKVNFVTKETNTEIRYGTGSLIEKGIRKLRIKLINQDTGKSQEWTVDI